MSCGNPTTEPNALMPKRKKYDKTKECIKCKVALGNIVVRHAVYCKECFIENVSYKFRRSLEPFVNPKPDGPRRTALKPSGNLLIGFSGGLGSTVLLELIHRCYVSMDKSNIPTDGGNKHPRHDRVWRKVTVCHVETCDVFPGMKDRTAEVEAFVARYDDIDFIPLRIQDAFDPQWWKNVNDGQIPADVGVDVSSEALPCQPSSSSTDPLETLRAHLASLPTATALPTTIHNLTRNLLLYTALQTSSSHLVLGTSLTSLAISLISGVSQGRGFNVKEEIQEEWSPVGKKQNAKSVRVVRPLRDVGRKECAMWAWWTGLHVLGQDRWPWSGYKQDIGCLTRDFIGGLEADYPSTVSTIARTCAKLAPRGDTAGQCMMCALPIQEGVQKWKARISLRTRSATTADITGSTPSLTPYLCYACQTTLTSRSSRPPAPIGSSPVPKLASTPLPIWIGSQLGERNKILGSSKMDEEEMRAAVQDCLLEA